jgi:organic radical activating enzyme
MPELSENIYNRSVTKAGRKLKLWRSAGLMLTYQCPAACEFCYYRCSPAKRGVMPLDTAMKAWQGIHELAGEAASVHITGGEPFLYLDEMVEILAEGRRRGLGQVDQIETNAYWADEAADISGILRKLDSLGMRVLKISCDPFHQEFIGLEKVHRLADVASEMLGEGRVLVRWEKYTKDSVTVAGLMWNEKAERYRASLAEYPCRFTGRAADRLADALAQKTVEEIGTLQCSRAFLGAKGVHIDPFGNVFSGTCSGIVIGNINDRPLADIWLQFDPPNADVIGWLFSGGPAAVARAAQADGFGLKARYAGGCHLCNDARKFFFDKGLFAAIIGPVQCYSEGMEASPQTCVSGIELSGKHGA